MEKDVDTCTAPILPPDHVTAKVDVWGEGYMAVTYTSEDGSKVYHGMLMQVSNRNDVPSFVSSVKADEWKQKLKLETSSDDTKNDKCLLENEMSSAASRVSSLVGSGRRHQTRPLRLRPAASRLVCLKCRGALETVTEGAAKRKMELNHTGEKPSKKPKLSKFSINPLTAPVSPPKLQWESGVESGEEMPKLCAEKWNPLPPLTIRLGPDREKGVIVRTVGNSNLVTVTTASNAPRVVRIHSKDSQFIKTIRSPNVALTPLTYKQKPSRLIVRSVSSNQCVTSSITSSLPQPEHLSHSLLPPDQPSPANCSNDSLLELESVTSIPKKKKYKPRTPKPVEGDVNVPDSSRSVVPSAEENPLGLLIGDAVWAKMHGEPYWPAKIFSFNPNAEACVLWLGSSQHGFARIDGLELFHTTFARRYNYKRSARNYQKAVFDAVEISKNKIGTYEFLNNVLLNLTLRKLIQSSCSTPLPVKGKRKSKQSRKSLNKSSETGTPTPILTPIPTPIVSSNQYHISENDHHNTSILTNEETFHCSFYSEDHLSDNNDSPSGALVIDETCVHDAAPSSETKSETFFDLDKDEQVYSGGTVHNHDVKLNNSPQGRECSFDSIISELQEMNNLCPRSPQHTLTTPLQG